MVEVVGRAPPAGLRTTPKRAEAGARGVDEHAIERSLRPRTLAPVVLADLDVRQQSHGLADQLGPVRLQLVGDKRRSSLGGQGAEQCRLSAGSGAQVEPSPVLSLDDGVDESDRNQLRALVLHARATFPHGSDLTGDSAVEDSRVGREESRLTGQLARLAQAGPGRERDAGWCVVGLEQRRQVAVRTQGLAERLQDPDRMRRTDGRGIVAIETEVTVSSQSSRSRLPIERSNAFAKWTGLWPISRRTTSTVVETAAWAGTRMPSSWCAPSRSASSTGASIEPMPLLATWSITAS